MRALTRPDPEYNCNPTTEISRLRSYRDATHVDSILDHRGRRPPPTPPRLTNLRVDPPTHRLRKGQRLQERVAGRAIGTVQPGATDFAHGVKMLNVGPAADSTRTSPTQRLTPGRPSSALHGSGSNGLRGKLQHPLHGAQRACGHR